MADVNFNLQQFLSEMRGEMHDGFERLDATATKVRADLVQHEMDDIKLAGETVTRLCALEKLADNLQWATRVIIGAATVGGLGLLFDIIRNHW